jgi:carbonic anhydrase
MCEFCRNPYHAMTDAARRQFLTLTTGTAAALALALPAFATNDAPPPKPQNVMSPDAALETG